MANKKLLEIDSSIFKNIHHIPDAKSCYDKYDNCIVIKRLLTTLSYYTHLDINNTNDKYIFCNFIETIYKYGIYDDFHHFRKYHENDIELIMNLAIKSYKLLECDISSCLYCSTLQNNK